MRLTLLSCLILFAAQLSAQDDCRTLQSLLQKGDIVEAVSLIRHLAPEDAMCNNLAGEAYLRKGRNDLAQKYFEAALKMAGEGSEERATGLNNLGLVYWNMGSGFEARAYIRQALDIRKKLYSHENEQLAASYNDLGLVAETPYEALENYEKALDIYLKLYGKTNQKVAQAKTNIGIIYRDLELFGDAQNNFNEALNIWQTLQPEGHPNEGFIHTNLGRTYQLMGNIEGAKASYKKALDIYKKHYGDKHPEIARTLNLIGNVYNSSGAFEEALGYYQQALIANSIHFDDTDVEANPSLDQYFNANTLLNTLYYKAQALEDLHHNLTLKFKDVKLSLATLQVADTLVDKIRKITTNESDKLALGEIASQVYENGVRLCYYMATVAVKKDPYYELSFYFAEKSKSAILLQAISDAAAKSFANIPDSKLREENELKTEIAFYEQKLAQKPDADAEKQYRQQLFELEQRYNSFVSDLEKNYPQYFNLKYHVPIPTVGQLQQTLDDKTALISYFIADRTKRLYVFEITKDKFIQDNVAQNDDFDRYISGLRNSIYFHEDDVYNLTASSLYDVLFPSGIPKSVNKLVIIPAGRLGTIPFEALLTKAPKTSDHDYSTFNYLINSYAVNYQYASALYYQNNKNPQSITSQNGAFLCAPVTFPNLADLPGTSDEVNQLEQILTAKHVQPEIFLEAHASEEAVKTHDLSHYRYLHFATHGVVNERNPALSRIFLKETPTNDGSLYSGEIYNLKLGADLVTLSACETGLGKVSKGEGIIGLSRALLYAGANNIVVSLWSVADASTSTLMTDFYSNIADANYSYALQQAKLKMIHEQKYARPYFWAPFILIGQ